MSKQKKQDKSATQAGLNIAFEQPEDGICEVYSNVMDVNWTRTDVRIRFAQVMPTDPQVLEEKPGLQPWYGEEQAAVTVPWPMAKFLRDLLSELIKRYEKVNGEIKMPELPMAE